MAQIHDDLRALLFVEETTEEEIEYILGDEWVRVRLIMIDLLAVLSRYTAAMPPRLQVFADDLEQMLGPAAVTPSP